MGLTELFFQLKTVIDEEVPCEIKNEFLELNLY
jgi:hypothetical protein